MNKVLWCGGSHLANATAIIREQYLNFDNHFLVTAGPILERWGKSGGKYIIKDSARSVSRERVGRLSAVNLISLYILVLYLWVSGYSRGVYLFRGCRFQSLS